MSAATLMALGLAGTVLVAAWLLLRRRRELAAARSELSTATSQLVDERNRRVIAESEVTAAADRSSRLLDMARDFAAAVDEAHVVEALTRNAQQLVEPAGTVAWTAGVTSEPIWAFSVGRVEPGRPGWHVVRALRSGHAVTDPGGDNEHGTVFALPLTAGGSAYGVLELRGVPDSRAPSLHGLATLVAHAATAISLARLHDAASGRSLRDPLTGVANRRRLEEDLATEISIARRGGDPLAFVLLDLDNFKRYNDEHGHRAGDDALVDVVTIVTAASRASDTVYRYGGQQYALMLRNTDADAAAALAERLREAVDERLTARRLTLSAGVAALPEHAVAADGLVDAATTAMREAKRAGRNQVVVAPTQSGTATVVTLPGRG